MSILEVKSLTKKFGDFTANDHIDLSIERGEIRAIIGENGAGKTTLMNMLYGILQPTSGEIIINEEKKDFHSPRDAIKAGIGMVHQHFKLVPGFTVYENIVLGNEINKSIKIGSKSLHSPIIDTKKEKEEIAKLIEKFNFNLNVDDRIKDISVGARQRVEILKMIYRNIDVLILDEPTAVLIPQEVDELLAKLQELKKQGKTIIIITHKLAEVKLCADRISVMRRGKIVGTVENDAHTSQEDLAEMMVGRKVLFRLPKSETKKEGTLLYSVHDICAKDRSGREVIRNVSFDIHAGEVLGVVGVEGNGQSELMLLLSGLMKFESGHVFLKGKDVTGLWPDKLRELGLGIIPEDRYIQGLCKDLTVQYNLVAGYHGTAQFCKMGLMRNKNIQAFMDQKVTEFDIRLSSANPKVSSLSGGNAQKIILAREIGQNPSVLISSQATRGLDIGATEFVQKNILKLREEGKAVLYISSEMSEVISVSDRIIVLYRGEVVGEFDAHAVSQRELGLYMSGAKRMEKEVLA